MTDYTPCAVGCTIEADGIEYPRPATCGAFCPSCAIRIRARLDEAPTIARVLRAAVAGLRAVDTTSVRVDGSREAPLPFDDGMLEAADELFATISNWAISHAQAMGITGGLPGRLSRLAEVEKDARHIETDSSPQKAAEQVREVVDWLKIWGDSIAWSIAPASLAIYHDDIVDLIRRMRGKAGLSEPRRRARRRVCNVCGEQEVEASVPDVGPEIVRCTSCHAVWDSSAIEWERAA